MLLGEGEPGPHGAESGTLWEGRSPEAKPYRRGGGRSGCHLLSLWLRGLDYLALW